MYEYVEPRAGIGMPKDICVRGMCVCFQQIITNILLELNVAV
jgi:hypothetical protein